MQPTRRRICLLAVGLPLAGCVTDPGSQCRGGTVRLSLRPGTFEDIAIRFDVDSLSAEAIGVIETAIEDEHVERCVSWDPGPDETGPSAGLAEIVRSIRTQTSVDPETGIERTVLFRDDSYRLSLLTDPDG